MSTLNLNAAQRQRVDTWKSELADLLTKPDADVQVAAHIQALEGLGLEPTTQARLLATSMIGAAKFNATTNQVDDGGRANLRNQLGSGLLAVIGLARGKSKTLQGIVGEQKVLAKNLRNVARQPLAQTIVEHLQAKYPGEVSAVNVKGLLLTSTGRFLAVRDGEASGWLYGRPSKDTLNLFGVTPDSLNEALLALTRQIAEGETLKTDHLTDFPFWRSFQKNPGPLAPLPDPTEPLSGTT